MSNKNGLIIGIFYFIVGILVAIGPHTIFAVCEAMEGKYMKCHWTAQAEIGVGISIAIVGGLYCFIRSSKIRLGLQIALYTVLAQIALLPDVLIGVCEKEHMQCRSLTLPALNVLTVLGIAVGVVNLIYLLKRKDKESERA